MPNGTSCADDSLCNGQETCQQGVCAPGVNVECGNDCLICSSQTGQCVAVAEGSPCEGAFTCSANQCVAGVCEPGPRATCFTVSGTVTGLLGSGLALRNRDNGDVRTITTNGDFTFEVPVPNGQHYTIVIDTQPTTPPQICRITQHSGSIAGASVTNVVVSCGRCGNHVVDPGEQCDHGDVLNGDGCSSICRNEACTPGQDSDGDRLDDCAETNTGEFLSQTNTGTDPNNADTDGDGLSDGDETLGTAAGLDLPALGASPVRKDLFLELDWFDDNAECGHHSHRPTPNLIAIVKSVFANSPLLNPDGSLGIDLHVDYGQDTGTSGPLTGGNWLADREVFSSSPPEAIGAELEILRSSHFAANRNGAFSYGILVHRIEGSALFVGPGKVFIASPTGCDICRLCGERSQDHSVAWLLLAGLGENLGLNIGGDNDCTLKPNYPSLMNVRWRGHVDLDCDDMHDNVFDFSRGSRPPLNENALDETSGVCGGFAPIDWNGNGIIDEIPVSVDVNSYPGAMSACGGDRTTLNDHNDWDNMIFTQTAQNHDNALAPPYLIATHPAQLDRQPTHPRQSTTRAVHTGCQSGTAANQSLIIIAIISLLVIVGATKKAKSQSQKPTIVFA